MFKNTTILEVAVGTDSRIVPASLELEYRKPIIYEFALKKDGKIMMNTFHFEIKHSSTKSETYPFRTVMCLFVT
jgi:hypothetical protein